MERDRPRIRTLRPSVPPWMVLAFVGAWWATDPARAQIAVRTDFEGGSARDIFTDDARQAVRLAPGGDPKRGWPCWWYARIEGLTAGRPLTLEVTVPSTGLGREHPTGPKPLSADWLFPARATYSADGTTWKHSGPGTRAGDLMTYTIDPVDSIDPASGGVFVAWGPPFTPEDAAALVRSAETTCPAARGFELCKSNGGRTVPGLRIRDGELPEDARFGVWVGARQHAWESGSSWVAQGFVNWLVGDDPGAAWVRRHADVTVIPIMDVDHVAEGQGGKGVEPADHNRAWTDAPPWAEVAAAQEGIRVLAERGRMDLYLDLHNPAPRDLRPFFFVSEDEQLTPVGRTCLERWLTAARGAIADPVPLTETPRTAGPGYDPRWRQISGNWVQAHGNPQTVAACLETPWNTEHGTTDGYEAVGRQLGRAVETYLRARADAREESQAPSPGGIPSDER